MLGHRLRRWSNIKPALAQHNVTAGNVPSRAGTISGESNDDVITHQLCLDRSGWTARWFYSGDINNNTISAGFAWRHKPRLRTKSVQNMPALEISEAGLSDWLVVACWFPRTHWTFCLAKWRTIWCQETISLSKKLVTICCCFKNNN